MNQPKQKRPPEPAVPVINGDCWSDTLGRERHDPK
jgi:hypothetical protein